MIRFAPAIVGLTAIFAAALAHAQDTTYAEKLGWPDGARVLILHVDDAGMSHDSNRGAIQAIEDGVATSMSVMMPCPWVPEIVEYIKANPETDAGLHLTLNAEWAIYRWGPLAGKPAVPGLVDAEGALWHSTQQVVRHATPDEVETEIRAQLDRARAMGFEPTHLDSHMGTVLATPEFMQRYIQVGIENKIPVMFPGGHNFYAAQLYGERAGDEARAVGQILWQQGLPVLDDLHNTSYGWARKDKVAKYVEAVRGLKPGVTMMIMHCTDPTEIFPKISGSGPSRQGDLEAMLSAKLRKTIEKEGIILSTWRELMLRRAQADD